MAKREFIPCFIPKRTLSCQHCRNVFKSEQTYYSALIEDANESAIRFDYCEECWTSSQPQERTVSWKGKIPASLARKENDQARLEKALELFRGYAHSASEQEMGQEFILALYLERKKQVVLRKDMAGQLLYEVLENGEMISISKQNLENLDIPTLQGVLSARLGFEV